MATLKDVARKAGVSISTVSRVFNDPEKVRPDTRQRVRKASEALNYKPSRVARRLRVQTGETNLIGLIIPDIQNPFFAEVARGVEDVARDHNYAVIFSNSDEDPENQKVALDTLQTEDVDGVIVPPVDLDDAAVKDFAESSIPIVCVDRQMADLRLDTILSDNRQGAHDAVTHLIEHGHGRIAFIGGIARISTLTERREGYEAALRDHDLPVDPALVREGELHRERGKDHTEALLALDRPPTALFTGNNLTTLGALAALNQHDVRVPEDMALVGYDDIPWADALNPPPTVIDQPSYEMGQRAAELLLQRLDAPDRSPTVVTLQPKLIVRQSCGADSDST
ncbi:MAG: LacI family DNA-binding transcriptional regulator [Salinibacter sp.]|uniref:LacI family DNA-binding transcriptional regulator n=1 Tax=Salinibacter sp. TaxID=2065818 RepID=UPI0035D4EAD0